MNVSVISYISIVLLIPFLISCNKEDEDSFEKDSGTFTDKRDQNNYDWVKIGEQIWMAENLAYLPHISTLSENISPEQNFYVFGYVGTEVNDAKQTNNYKTYGVLYNWTAAKNSCPAGWHLPTDFEWELLSEYISQQKGPYINSGSNWSDIGKHLKATTSWNNDGYGIDDFGFGGLAAGYIGYPGAFYDLGNFCYWWSATEANDGYAWSRSLEYDNNSFYRRSNTNAGFSVRCIKD
jgi:uncharacterized protein (TIGR02145 family)